MSTADWLVIVGYLGITTLVGLLFVRRASESVAEYFVAGRKLPWWLAGTSLVATSFAADTPLFVAGLIATKGIAGNWLWWNQVVAWSLAIACFARLWRRTGVVTDAEFIELRYSGRSASMLRAFRGLYMSTIFSTATLAWVMLAMQKIVSATMAAPAWVVSLEASIAPSLGLEPAELDLWKWVVLASLFLLATLYTTLSGMWGIVATDLLQFVVAMGGSAILAWYAVDAVGGVDALQSRLAEQFGVDRASEALGLFPSADSEWMPVSALAVYLTILWWGDCNGFAAQRLFSTRSERDSVLASLWYAIMHFAVRPWPWVLVGCVALVMYPGLEDPESGYPKLLVEILPSGVRGLLLASLLAAFMSTVDTHLNWNASYFVNDIYRRFLVPGATESQCVAASRLAVVGYALLAVVVAYFMTSIESGVLLLFNLQAGIGLVLMLRWFWWRINAWSEISAMIASLAVTTALPLADNALGLGWSPATRIVLTALTVTPIWVAATFLTQPTDNEKLLSFYRTIRPPSTFWKPVARLAPDVQPGLGLGRTLACWLLVATMLFGMMFAIGDALFLRPDRALAWSAVAVVSAVVLWRGRLIRMAD